MKLRNKVAVITGSSRGIGRATALIFAEEGAKVVVNYKDSEQRATEVVDIIRGNGGLAIAVRADVSNPDGIKTLFTKTMETFETVDILVNNAGICTPKPFLELTVDDISAVFSVNIVGVVLCTQAAAKIMIPRETGRIINIASISGIRNFGTAGNMPYAMSKAAVVNATGMLAKALGPNILVNCIAPGFVDTEMPTSPEYVERVIKDSALKRMLRPEEIARTCLFLASEDSSGITGEVIHVDAGFQLK